MAVQKTTPTGATFNIPEAGDPDWGQEMTDYLFYLGDALVAGQTIEAAEITTPSVTVVPTANQVVDATGTSLITFNPAANITLSAATPIATPTNKDGKWLTLINIHATNTVTIPDSGNVDINGPVTLGSLNTLQLVWIDAKSKWVEVSRNN